MAKILVIDDDQPNARLISLMLGLDGHSVETEDRQDHALQALKLISPDLILSDYYMYGQEASGFLSQVRQVGYSGKILLCTAAALDQIHADVDAILRKPFAPKQLSRMVDQLLTPA